MLIVVIVCNLLLTLLNLYLVTRLWRLRRNLAKVTKTLIFLEHRIHRIFSPAPTFVIKGQQGTSTIRQRYQQLLLQLEALQQFATVINLGLRLWRRQGKRQQLRKLSK